MKDLHTTPDEHLEARLTALALGEASPFEAAELEALCATKPELQSFLNRTKALHSLLLETPPSSSDQFWKLSPERRAKLDPIIGPKTSSHSNKDSSIRRAAYRTAFGIAAVLAVTLFTKRFIFTSESLENASMTIVGGSEFNLEISESDGRLLEANDQEVFFEKKNLSAQRSSPAKEASSPPVIFNDSRQNNSDLAANETGSGEFKSLESKSEVRGELTERSRISGGEFEKRKAKSPSSSIPKGMAAANSPAPVLTPAPAPGPALAAKGTKPSLDYGDGKDIGGGQGETQGNVVNGKNDGGIGYASGAGGRTDITNTHLATEALAATDDAFASNDSRQKSGFTYEAKKFRNATETATVPGIPSETATSTGSGTIAGLRSGDYAVQRESIDAILNNPDRTATDGVTALPAFKGQTQPDDLAFSDSDSIRTKPAITNVKDKDFDQRRLESGKVVDTKSDYYRAAYDETTAKNSVDGDKNQELALSNRRVQNDAFFADRDSRPTDDPFAAAAKGSKDASVSNLDLNGLQSDPFAATPVVDPFASSTTESIGQNADVAEGGLKRDLSTLTKGKDEMTLNFDPQIAEFEGFINYGAPIAGEPLQVDSTKIIEITQANNKELGFDWVFDPFTKGSKITTTIPVTPASPANFEDINISGKVFKSNLTDLSEELSTTQEVFSTFSLNISDASFQLASAAIARGERPDPESIKPEQFYNGVDYGDPAPSASEPVSAAIDQTAHPVIPGRNLVRVAVRTASAGRSAAQPLRLTLLVDQSGSMVRADRRAAMETALASLATLLTENDQVTVIGFSRTPHLLAEALPGNEAGKLSNLINQEASEGGTNLEQAINLATEQALRHRLDGAQNRIVLFTDGAANLGDADPERLSNKIETIRQQGVAFDIAGIGTNDVNDKLLSDLARHGNGRYYLVGEKTANTLATQLAGAFRPAAENVKIQVKLNPQRVGNYKLIGFEKDRLKTEDFRNDSVDAAELAADEAGVAIYQVETLPQGTGEIGEVSIRFRDTASDEMVERKWTIPYDASAPSFDKANPKTQLATLALLAAQKLQPGPLADAIDFSNYSETIAKLKQANANSSKTQQLLDLINKLK